MNSKHERITAVISTFEGRGMAPHYLAYLDCFNRQLFFEAHEMLEPLWLLERHAPTGAFYKGLIQLAGAFVHLQKHRLAPAAALFKLATANLRRYPPIYQRLNVEQLLHSIEKCMASARTGEVAELAATTPAPHLTLEPPTGAPTH